MTDLPTLTHVLKAELEGAKMICENLNLGLARLEGAMTAMAGNDERRRALANQCQRLRRLAATLCTPQGQDPQTLSQVNAELAAITRAVACFSHSPDTGTDVSITTTTD
jgi:hypothetical protein